MKRDATHTCAGCGRQFKRYVAPSRAREFQTRFCTRECHGRHGLSIARPVNERFWKNVRKEEDGCWEWTGTIDSKGYGMISIKGLYHRAHRYSWSLHNERPAPSDMDVCHACDNRPCVRPDHLFLGTRSDNLMDMQRKGRGQRGETHHNSKLNEVAVRVIRYAYSKGVTIRRLATLHHVTDGAISNVVKNLTWQHVA